MRGGGGGREKVEIEKVNRRNGTILSRGGMSIVHGKIPRAGAQLGGV